MRRYRVILTPRATADIEAIYDYIARDSPGNAGGMVERLFAAAQRLDELPYRHPVAPESRTFKRPMRQFIVRPYRIVYEIGNDVVSVVTFRHAKRRPLKPEF